MYKSSVASGCGQAAETICIGDINPSRMSRARHGMASSRQTFAQVPLPVIGSKTFCGWKNRSKSRMRLPPLLVFLGFRNCVTHELCGALFALVVAAAREVFHVGKRKAEGGAHFSPGILPVDFTIHRLHGETPFE
jgi:hypothetical protein